MDRLHQVVVCAEIEAAHALRGGATAGQDDHWKLLAEASVDLIAVADLAQDVKA